MGFDTIFWFTILLIVLSTIIGTIVKARQKDRCLKLFNQYHITFLSDNAPPAWGDLLVSSSGLELLFAKPYTNKRGMTKRSFLVFQEELKQSIAICRTPHALTDKEILIRQKQLKKTFNPHWFRRLWRMFRNLLNTAKDAVSNIITLLVGKVSKTRGGLIQDKQQDVSKISQQLVIGFTGNAYEPILEKYIGKPVIIELINNDKEITEFIGYLVEYTADFVSVFSVTETPIATQIIPITSSEVTNDYINIARKASNIFIRNTQEEPVIVKKIKRNEKTIPMGVVLLKHSTLKIPSDVNEIEIEITRELDIVCNRNRTRVRYGAKLV